MCVRPCVYVYVRVLVWIDTRVPKRMGVTVVVELSAIVASTSAQIAIPNSAVKLARDAIAVCECVCVFVCVCVCVFDKSWEAGGVCLPVCRLVRKKYWPQRSTERAYIIVDQTTSPLAYIHTTPLLAHFTHAYAIAHAREQIATHTRARTYTHAHTYTIHTHTLARSCDLFGLTSAQKLSM